MKERARRIGDGNIEELEEEEYEVWKLQIESSGRVRKLLQWHLGLELARNCT